VIAPMLRMVDWLRLLRYSYLPMNGVSEEVLLFRALFRSTRGVMVDVGAHHGYSLMPFALRGWNVHALEPDPKNRARLLERCGRFRNISVDERAISLEEGEATLFTSTVSSGISTLKPFHSSHHATTTVKAVRLSTLCSEREITRIDFLKVDVEGLDLQVLRSHDWHIKPDVVMCEFEDHKTLPLGHGTLDIIRFLTDLGYRVLVSEWDPVVRYGANHRWRRIFKAEDQAIQPESWGNLIALKTEAQITAVLAAFKRET
jgi:FkbM family methyltransferase